MEKEEEQDLPITSADDAAADVELEAKIDKVLEDWVASTYRNSPIGRDTPAYNHLRSKLPDLKSAILKELKE